MTRDLSVIVQEAFTVLRDDAQEVAKASVMIKSEKIQVEELAKMLLAHLCELNLIEINLDRLAQAGGQQADKFAYHATLTLPANQAARLATEIQGTDPEYYYQACSYLDKEIRLRLLAILEELEQ